MLIAKDFDLPSSQGLLNEEFKIVSKVFDNLFCNDKNQIMIIKLLNVKVYRKSLEKTKHLLAICFSILSLSNPEPPYAQIIIKILLVELFLNCRLVHTSRCNQ